MITESQHARLVSLLSELHQLDVVCRDLDTEKHYAVLKIQDLQKEAGDLLSLLPYDGRPYISTGYLIQPDGENNFTFHDYTYVADFVR